MFEIGDFVLHSGGRSDWKIDCDSLTDDDLAAIAQRVMTKFHALGIRFSKVEGIARGGVRLAVAFTPWLIMPPSRLLIVDDVLTTGKSMEEQRAGREAIGVVIFARGRCPTWITPVFQMHYVFRAPLFAP